MLQQKDKLIDDRQMAQQGWKGLTQWKWMAQWNWMVQWNNDEIMM